MLTKHWSTLALIVLILFSFHFLFTALNIHVAPPGSDPGNYLSVLNALFGHDVTGHNLAFKYPPLYYVLLLLPLTKLLDTFLALKISAILAFISAVIAFFLLSKWICRNDVATLIATFFFGFSGYYFEMICWGGHANILAMSFMLLAIYFLLKSFEKESKSSLVLSAFFASLLIGTHHLSAVTFAITLLMFMMLHLLTSNGRRSRISLLKNYMKFFMVIAMFSSPLIAWYKEIFEKSSIDFENFSLLSDQNVANLVLSGFDALFKDTSVFWVAVMCVSIAYVILHERHARPLIVSLILASIFTSLLFLRDPLRGLAFIYIPICLALSLLLSNLKYSISQKGRSSVICLSLIFLLTFSIAQYTSSEQRLVNAIKYYHVMDDDTIEALNWLKNNTDRHVATATNDFRLVWWIEGFAERKSYGAYKYPVYVYWDQIADLDLGNIIMGGNHIIRNGYIMLSDFFPAGFRNPAVSMYIGGGFQDVLIFNDAYFTVFVSPSHDPTTVWKVAPFYAKSKVSYVDITPQYVTLTANFIHGKFVNITRIMKLEDRPQAEISYYINYANSFGIKADVAIRIGDDVKVLHVSNTTNGVVLTVRDYLGIKAEVEVLIQTDGSVRDIRYLRFDEQWKVPTLRFAIDGNVTEVHFLVKMLSFRRSDMKPTYFNALDLMKEKNIQYIVLNKALHEYLHRFTYTDDFEKVFENRRIMILRVKL